MRFDWRNFCERHHVPFVTSGPNTARGHISIQCPYCGASDKSQHMGLSLNVDDPVWGCFRNSKHRGGNPRRLVQKLLGISFDEARTIVQSYGATADADDFSKAMKRLGEANGVPLGGMARQVFGGSLSFPTDFKPIIPGRGYADRFVDYLKRDRFFGDSAGEVCDRYGLHYALTGDFAWRLIFPIFEEDGRLAGWTGRDIRPSAWLRYRASDQLPHHLIYNAHEALRFQPRTLVVVEGPVDAIKVDYFGRPYGMASVATMGTALPRERVAALAVLAKRFDRVALLFDEGTLSEVTGLVPELSELAGKELELWRPGAMKDPGAMNAEQVRSLLICHASSPR